MEYEKEWRASHPLDNTTYIGTQKGTIAKVEWFGGITIPEQKANAGLICKAVNACISVNPQNPLAAADGIKGVVEALEALKDGWNATKHEACMEALASIHKGQ